MDMSTASQTHQSKQLKNCLLESVWTTPAATECLCRAKSWRRQWYLQKQNSYVFQVHSAVALTSIEWCCTAYLVEALYAHAEPVDPQSPVVLQALQVKGAGICFK